MLFLAVDVACTVLETGAGVLTEVPPAPPGFDERECQDMRDLIFFKDIPNSEATCPGAIGRERCWPLTFKAGVDLEGLLQCDRSKHSCRSPTNVNLTYELSYREWDVSAAILGLQD